MDERIDEYGFHDLFGWYRNCGVETNKIKSPLLKSVTGWQRGIRIAEFFDDSKLNVSFVFL